MVWNRNWYTWFCVYQMWDEMGGILYWWGSICPINTDDVNVASTVEGVLNFWCLFYLVFL